nr:MAG TPA: hypothetical protein [Caudoviricetes sp.]
MCKFFYPMNFTPIINIVGHTIIFFKVIFVYANI